MKSFFEKKSSEFLEYLKSLRHLSDSTVSTYSLNLFEALNEIGIEKDGDVFEFNLIPYRTKLINKKKKTIAKKISIIRSFVAFLKDQKINVLLVGDEPVRVPKTLPKPISNGYIKEALEHCSLEEKVLIFLIYGLGLRISEVSNLKLADITADWVMVLGKGSKHRSIPVLKEVRAVLDEFIAKDKPKEYVFEKDGKKLSENSLRYRLSKVFKRIGIKATPHQLRHSFASDLLNNGGRVADIGKLLGHSSLGTTEIYTKLNGSYKLKNYLEAHPLCKD